MDGSGEFLAQAYEAFLLRASKTRMPAAFAQRARFGQKFTWRLESDLFKESAHRFAVEFYTVIEKLFTSLGFTSKMS
jgi:hypothetical protein